MWENNEVSITYQPVFVRLSFRGIEAIVIAGCHGNRDFMCGRRSSTRTLCHFVINPEVFLCKNKTQLPEIKISVSGASDVVIIGLYTIGLLSILCVVPLRR